MNDINKQLDELFVGRRWYGGYDLADQLTSASYTGTPNETYAYDGVGNRTSSHKSATYSYQPFNRLASTATATYLYNNNGNMVSKSDASGTTQFAWDFENRLVQVVTPSSGSVSYKYDALGRRIQRTPSSGIATNFVYDSQDVVKDIHSDGSTIEYLNGPGIDNKIRQKGSSTSTTYYFSQDHLGSTTALTGTTGKLVERQTYDAYGNSTGSTRTRYGYTGRERDADTGLIYYRARFYDPQVGRFISEDPIGFDGGGMNFYLYVGNNPIDFSDPFGLKPVPRSRTRTRPCDAEEMGRCTKICGSKGVESCRVSQTFRLVRWKDGLGLRRWVDGPLSCSCNDCDDTPPPVPVPIPFVPILPSPRPLKPVPWWQRAPIPRFPVLPIMINPCLVVPDFPGCPRQPPTLTD